MVYRTVAELDFSLQDVPEVALPGNVLFTIPAYFDVRYVINPHMAGQIGNVDREAAHHQWSVLRQTYANLGYTLHDVEGVESLYDMVFCANQTLPYLNPTTGAHGVVLSRMHAAERRDEVPHYATFFENNGYRVHTLPASLESSFEGMGDAIWHPGRYLLWGGYGFRTDPAAYRFISNHLGVRVLALELDDPDFYHLDTCFSALTPSTVLIYPGAFKEEGLALIHHVFEHVLEAPEDEARRLFACNAHCPNGRHVIIQQGCEQTNELLHQHGLIPVEVDTREFLKAGGSVFCMKLMYW